MMVTQRTRDIYLVLLNNLNNFQSIKEIADQLNVTERTIYRQLKEVNEIASFYDISILNEVGLGIKLSAKDESIAQIKSLFLSKNPSFELSNQDRLSTVIFILLHEEDFVKAKYFAEILKVSIQSIRNDLVRIKEDIKPYGLKLISKQANGFAIDGEEVQKRILLSNIIRENVSFIDMMQWIGEEKILSIYTKILTDLGYHAIFGKVSVIYRNLFKEENITISDEMYQDLIILTSLLVKRVNNVKDDYHISQVSDKQVELFSKLSNQLEKEFHIVLNKQEEAYLNWIVNINSNSDSKLILEEQTEIDLVRKVNDFIIFVETTMGCRLRNDGHLQTALFEHLDRTLARTRSGITIKNPMLSEIKKSYEKLYSTIKIAASYVFPNDKFPEDEIGFLVLHFAVALDKVLDKSVNALVVCSSGMGSSKMLANRLMREIPEIEIKKIVSFMNLTKENLSDYDVIFSTVSLPISSDDYVMVSPLLNKKELTYVKRVLENIRFGKLHRKELLIPRKTIDLQKFPALLDEISLVSKYGSDILKKFQVVEISNVSDEFEILTEIDHFLFKNDFSVQKDILTKGARESTLDSFFGIPNTKLGYIHCRSKQIKTPLFIVFEIENGAEFSSLEEELIRVTSVILVMSPVENENIITDLLSMMTMLIIESPDSIDLFEKANHDQIFNLISERIKNHLVEKIL